MPLETVGASHKRYPKYSKKWHIDILVSVCKEGFAIHISLKYSCSQEIHPCDNCCTTWAHPWVPTTVGGWWFFSSQNPSPKPPWFEPWSCELRVSGDPNLFKKTMKNCGLFLFESWWNRVPSIYTTQMARIWGDRFFFCKAVFLLGIRKMMSLGKGTPPETSIAFVVGRGLFSEAKKSVAQLASIVVTLGYWYRRWGEMSFCAASKNKETTVLVLWMFVKWREKGLLVTQRGHKVMGWYVPHSWSCWRESP